MPSTQEVSQPGDTDPKPTTGLTAADWHADAGQREGRESERPRIIEELQIVGPNSEDDLEAVDDRGRRWHDPQPGPRRPADLMGWLVLWVTVVILLFVPSGDPISQRNQYPTSQS
jgi:hypothetical protein